MNSGKSAVGLLPHYQDRLLISRSTTPYTCKAYIRTLGQPPGFSCESASCCCLDQHEHQTVPCQDYASTRSAPTCVIGSLYSYASCWMTLMRSRRTLRRLRFTTTAAARYLWRQQQQRQHTISSRMQTRTNVLICKRHRKAVGGAEGVNVAEDEPTMRPSPTNIATGLTPTPKRCKQAMYSDPLLAAIALCCGCTTPHPITTLTPPT